MGLKISIVTPSLNQGRFLESTIRSVVEQDYEDLEYIIIDGGSTDNSVDIIRKYEKYITYWVSELDSGQSHAINKGFAKCTGDIVAWLNSDDEYVSGTLGIVGRYMEKNPAADIVFGDQEDMDENGETFRSVRWVKHSTLAMLSLGIMIPQPASFYRRKMVEEIGELDESLYWVMDYEWFLRMALAGYKFCHIPKKLARFRYHRNSKTIIGTRDGNEHWEHLYQIQANYLHKYNNLIAPLRLSPLHLRLIRGVVRNWWRFRNIDRYIRYWPHYAEKYFPSTRKWAKDRPRKDM
jgi:glycosyltransferase involved in cell wall biosynthesis